ncbi:MAG TPA: DUF6603 domain-containing protein [Nocardioidaceae bacterium]|nr:DUF6603 domain-containing protein [Nocardioidaceae bacterium]
MAADDKDLLQIVGREIVDFLEWMGRSLGDPQLVRGLLADLGATPETVPPVVGPAPEGIDAVKAWLDTSSPSIEATVQAVGDIATAVDQLLAVLEALAHDSGLAGDDIAHALLELGATNFARLRWPRLFVVLQAVSTINDLSSTYGPGNNNPVAFFKSLGALFGYLWQPGKSIEHLVGGPDAAPGTAEAVTDLVVRLAAVTLAAIDMKKDIEPLRDVLAGWDAPELSPDSPDIPSRADVVSSRMTSISVAHDRLVPGDAAVEEFLNLTTAMIHEAEGGPGLFVAVGGNLALQQKLGTWWTFTAKARADGAVAVLWKPPGDFDVAGPAGGDFEFRVGYAARPPARPSTPDAASVNGFPIRLTSGTRIDIGEFTFEMSLTDQGAEALVRITESALVLEPKDHDGFLAGLIGEGPLRLPFGLELGPSSSRGMVARYVPPGEGAPAQSVPLAGDGGNSGAAAFAVTVPLGKALGPITVHEIGLRLSRGPVDLPPPEQTRTALEIDITFSARIGPVHLRVDQLGLAFTLDNGVPEAQRNLRLVDLGFDTKLPRGVAVNVETSLVAGGGSISHDPDQGTYFGVLDLAFKGGLTAQAICLVATKKADGTKGFSMVAILTVELGTPWQLGMGFHLDGFGGLLALHRTFDDAAVRAALPTGQLRHVLFPSDPVHHTAEVLQALTTLFPAQRDSHLFGLLVKIGWASPTLIAFELGVLYQWGTQHRLIILGRVSAILPRPDLAIIRLNMDAVGVLDFDRGTFSLDAVLYDSKLCDRFVLTGAMAMRMGWKDAGPGFALSVGGLHPRFVPPAGFPSVARLQLALTTGTNPKLVCQAYFAVTSNTVQFGADCSLYAAAYGFSINGDVGFDVLIQLLPFHFLAEFRASVQLKRGTRNLFKVSLSGALEGPLPLRVAGKASFEILWCDFSVAIDATLVDGGTPNDLVLVDVLSILLDALSDPGAWQAELPKAADSMVSLRRPVTQGVLLHPLGRLTVRQNVVPLGLDRDIERVGTGTPGADRRFRLTRTALGSQNQERSSVRELFAPGQYFDLSDDDRLAAPSFEPMDAGATFGESGYTTGTPQASPFDYTDITIDANGRPVQEPEPHHQALVLDLLRQGASSRAPVRRTLDRQFAAPVLEGAPTVNPSGWAAVPAEGPAPDDARLTWVEAVSQARDGRVVVPSSELR